MVNAIWYKKLLAAVCLSFISQAGNAEQTIAAALHGKSGQSLLRLLISAISRGLRLGITLSQRLQHPIGQIFFRTLLVLCQIRQNPQLPQIFIQRHAKNFLRPIAHRFQSAFVFRVFIHQRAQAGWLRLILVLSQQSVQHRLKFRRRATAHTAVFSLLIVETVSRQHRLSIRIAQPTIQSRNILRQPFVIGFNHSGNDVFRIIIFQTV